METSPCQMEYISATDNPRAPVAAANQCESHTASETQTDPAPYSSRARNLSWPESLRDRASQSRDKFRWAAATSLGLRNSHPHRLSRETRFPAALYTRPCKAASGSPRLIDLARPSRPGEDKPASPFRRRCT